MVKKVYATTNFDESLLPMEKMRLILPEASCRYLDYNADTHMFGKVNPVTLE